MELPVLDLTPAAFAPFGEVITRPERGVDAEGPGWQWWSDVALLKGDDRPFAIGYLDLQPSALQFKWAERHMRSPELLVPSGADCLVYVGPPEFPEEHGRMPPLESFRVFRVRQGQGVLLAPGVWHGAPLALDRPLNVVVLLLQKTGEIDNCVVRFPENPVTIKVE